MGHPDAFIAVLGLRLSKLPGLYGSIKRPHSLVTQLEPTQRGYWEIPEDWEEFGILRVTPGTTPHGPLEAV